MELDLSDNSLPVYQALASDVRLQILRLACEGNYSITDISKKINLSKAIVTKHVQKLEQAQLIKCERDDSSAGCRKISHLAVDNIRIEFPRHIYHSYSKYEEEMPLGNYIGFEVHPTCGLVSKTGRIGNFDDPYAFVDRNRCNAAMLWFSEGYVEYLMPNHLEKGQKPRMLEISMELASEFPYSNNVWPSDISFFLNEIPVGTWTCPGNFSDARGFYTPEWWNDDLSQYGLLKHIRVSDLNTSIDGEPISDITLSDLDMDNHKFIRLRIASLSNAVQKGGVTIFGRGFGNFDQDIICRLYYE